MKVRQCSKRLYLIESVKYMGVKIDANLNWQCQVNDLSFKLNRANTLLCKIREYVSPKIFRSIYFAVFESHLSYSSIAWAQNFRTIQWIAILQKKPVRITNFQPRNFHTNPLFKQNTTLKFQDKLCLEDILFISTSINKLTPSGFNTWFSFSSDQQYETSSSRQGNLIKSSYRRNRYGRYSIIASAIDFWNKSQKKLKNTLMKDLSLNNIKEVLGNFYIKSY